jgi:hypothetical protein
MNTIARIAVALLALSSFLCSAEQEGPSFYSDAGYVNATGQWRPADKSTESLPKNRVEIQCIREIKMCLEANATVVGGEPDVVLQNYRIVEWNRNDILAEDDSAICMANRLLINFRNESVTATDTPKKGAKGMPLPDGKNFCDLVTGAQTYKLVSPLVRTQQ